MLSQPFTHTEAFNPADGLPDPPDRDGFDSEELFNEGEDAYWQQHDAVVCAPEHTIGLLYLCHLGCAYREALVISGPARGQMWADDSADDSGFRPLHETDGTPTDFARWYRGWLKQAEDQAPVLTTAMLGRNLPSCPDRGMIIKGILGPAGRPKSVSTFPRRDNVPNQPRVRGMGA
jgi:hypothetical protein